jgi:glycosyltransferase involved in cell wall biosynthesis
MMARTKLIIPCYNEARRLDTASMLTLLDDDQLELLFVDDGSTDSTREILEQLALGHGDKVGLLALDKNLGKAEAVRRGLVIACESGAEQVGYLDADLATPPHEIQRLARVMSTGTAQVVVGARVALLGHKIERSAMRHYLGRVFATMASTTLRLAIYDTQCGAKLFRVTPTLVDAIATPFLSRWAFDVELIGRMRCGSENTPAIAAGDFWEEPLRVWRDVEGSKLAPRDMAMALLDLARIEIDLARRRARMAELQASHTVECSTADRE